MGADFLASGHEQIGRFVRSRSTSAFRPRSGPIGRGFGIEAVPEALGQAPLPQEPATGGGTALLCGYRRTRTMAGLIGIQRGGQTSQASRPMDQVDTATTARASVVGRQ